MVGNETILPCCVPSHRGSRTSPRITCRSSRKCSRSGHIRAACTSCGRSSSAFIRPIRRKRLRFYEKALQIYHSHPAGVASAVDISHRIAKIGLSKGELYLLSREYDKAHHALSSAAEDYERMTADDSENLSLLRELAEVYHTRGEVYFNQNSTEESLHYFEQSRDLRIKLESQADPKHRSVFTRDLARSYGYLGDLLLDQGHIAEAVKNYELSRSKRKDLCDQKPSDPDHRFQYARGIANFGFYEKNFGGHLDDAIKHLRDAGEMQDRLCDDFQEEIAFQDRPCRNS